MDRLDKAGQSIETASGGKQYEVFNISVDKGKEPGKLGFVRSKQEYTERLAAKYKYEPVLLETFVDAEKYTGACYKAANWIYLGNTKGRGRQDRYHTHLSSPKKIYMYPLVEDFRDYLTGKKNGGDREW